MFAVTNTVRASERERQRGGTLSEREGARERACEGQSTRGKTESDRLADRDRWIDRQNERGEEKIRIDCGDAAFRQTLIKRRDCRQHRS